MRKANTGTEGGRGRKSQDCVMFNRWTTSSSFGETESERSNLLEEISMVSSKNTITTYTYHEMC